MTVAEIHLADVKQSLDVKLADNTLSGNITTVQSYHCDVTMWGSFGSRNASVAETHLVEATLSLHGKLADSAIWNFITV